MRKFFTAFASAALVAVTTLSSIAVTTNPASAQMRDRERYVERYCARNPRDSDCRDFRRGHRHWDERRYQRWYRKHHDRNDNAAAAIFGLAAGIAGGIAAGANAPRDRGDRGVREMTRHQERCANRYRSYDFRSDTYIGNDGRRHACRL
ncbi:BA14K family protein [Consotaella salsifontis]|uniref:Lectin-like protein BA14k n=1 Tax=Consotaella salsifontis TaxID=1365950 RepID=A0A1T4PXD2_9HYPH|nr:BA14K family protein [Consotaella salsifontis]SJZ96172.1 BA14K-like protein [Consotaella salsifontis]